MTCALTLFRLPHGEGLALPAYETAGSAGMDIRAAVPADEPVWLKPGQRVLVPTGFKMAIDPDYEVQVRPRSGLALKHGITCLNTPGTIDSDYRGEISVLLINNGEEAFEISRGMRIAQLVVATVTQAQISESTNPLSDTSRGEGGFGSTGTL